ncbi:hypothetical protein CR983_00685 [Candidatus Saccharibacteria bacterium]|nr:MAG: hypothetical protein CR983_00685 [Candidatus Saccharibacteria bacterium]
MQGGSWQRDETTKRSWIDWLRSIALWQLMLLWLIVAIVASTFLHLNNIGMVERRDAVANADASGDEEMIADRLYDLQRYANAHMNADTGVIYLDKKYARDVEQLVKDMRSRLTSDDSNSVAARADRACKQRFSGYSQAYVECVRAEQDKNPVAEDPFASLKLPNPELYRYSYLSPVWSPDFTGWSLVVLAVLSLWIGLKLIWGIVLHVMFKWRYRQF